MVEDNGISVGGRLALEKTECVVRTMTEPSTNPVVEGRIRIEYLELIKSHVGSGTFVVVVQWKTVNANGPIRNST